MTETWTVNLWGLVLKNDDLTQFCKNLAKQIKETNDDEDIDEDNIHDLISSSTDENINESNCYYYEESFADTMSIKHTLSKNHTDGEFTEAIVICTDKQPTLTDNIYASEQDVIKEMKAKTAQLLPDFTDEDYKKNIGLFTCSCCCD